MSAGVEYTVQPDLSLTLGYQYVGLGSIGLPVPCPSLRVIMVSGGLVSRALMLEARAKLCSTIVNQYGSSEAGPTAFAMAEQIEDVEGGTGYVVPGAQVEIVDENDARLPPETDGIIRLRTDWQAQPFPPGSASAHSDFQHGWFYPGDRGRIAHDGLLILSGRTSEVINAGGLKLAPEVVEEILSGHPRTPSGIEEICVAIVARAPLSEQHIVEWCAERNVPISRVFLVETLPKTPSGKLHRSELKRQFTQS